MPLNAIPLSLRDLQSRCNAFCSKTHLPPIRGEFNAILEMLIACALVTTVHDCAFLNPMCAYVSHVMAHESCFQCSGQRKRGPQTIVCVQASYDDYEWALSGHEEGEVVARWERFFEPAFQRVNDTSGSD